MPTATIEGPKLKDLDARRTLVAEITRTLSKVYSIPEEKMVVLIRENPPENVGVGGKLLADRQRNNADSI